LDGYECASISGFRDPLSRALGPLTPYFKGFWRFLVPKIFK
jgi:hypothetical protein